MRERRIAFAAMVVLGVVVAAVDATAQGTDARPAPALDVIAGYAGFVDDAMIDHAVFGGAARIYVTPRLSVGPEVTYMVGPRNDRDLILTGNLTFDLLPDRPGRRLPVVPFVLAGGGLFRHSDRFGPETFTSSEGAFTGGGGARIWLGDRVYVVPEFRIGWELHYRVTAAVGIAMR